MLNEEIEYKLIPNEEAKLLWAKGENLEIRYLDYDFEDLIDQPLSVFDDSEHSFRLKPKRIFIPNRGYLPIAQVDPFNAPPTPVKNIVLNQTAYYWENVDDYFEICRVLNSLLKGEKYELKLKT